MHMSQLGNLKAQIDVVADQSMRMGGSLNGFRSQFNATVNQVQATIGGSAQGKDRALIEAIVAAQRQVDQAAAALMQAAATARSYSSSL